MKKSIQKLINNGRLQSLKNAPKDKPFLSYNNYTMADNSPISAEYVDGILVASWDHTPLRFENHFHAIPDDRLANALEVAVNGIEAELTKACKRLDTTLQMRLQLCLKEIEAIAEGRHDMTTHFSEMPFTPYQDDGKKRRKEETEKRLAAAEESIRILLENYKHTVSVQKVNIEELEGRVEILEGILSNRDNPSQVGSETVLPNPTDDTITGNAATGWKLSKAPTTAKAWNPENDDFFYWDVASKSVRETEIGMDVYEPDRRTRDRLIARGNAFQSYEEALGYSATRPFNPKDDGFWMWDGTLSHAVYIEPEYIPMGIRAYALKIGNAFQTREEAEDEGKWRLETKLVYDEALRVLAQAHNVTVSFLISQVEGVNYSHSFGYYVLEILGDDARRYWNGVA